MATDGAYRSAMNAAARQHGVLSTHHARVCGLSEQNIRHLVTIGVLERPAPGVLRVVGAGRSWRQRLMVAVAAAGPGCVVSHRAAAALHGFDRFPSGPVEVLVDRLYRSRDPRARIHSTRRLDTVDLTTVDGIPVTSPERTLIDLAASVGVNRLEEALDSGVRDHTVDLDRLRARIASLRTRGRRGVRKLERLVGGPTVTRPQSVLERRFLRSVEAAGLPTPECQVCVHRPDGSRAYVDFVFAGTNVAVEVDGHGAHATRRQRRHDSSRANDLVLADLLLLRFTYEQVVHDTDAVVADCRRALARAAA